MTTTRTYSYTFMPDCFPKGYTVDMMRKHYEEQIAKLKRNEEGFAPPTTDLSNRYYRERWAGRTHDEAVVADERYKEQQRSRKHTRYSRSVNRVATAEGAAKSQARAPGPPHARNVARAFGFNVARCTF